MERAAWWGGFGERLARSTKTCIRKVLGGAYLTYEEMHTVLTETEAVINSRPLTYLHTDSEDPSPLTPAHFLIGQRITTLPSRPIHVSETRKVDGEQLTRRWNYRRRLVNNFWNRWKTEYLMELRSAHCTSMVKPVLFKIGDLVLIHEDKLPRHMWKMGRVEEVFHGRDNVRACSIRLSTRMLIRRPIQLLYHLEVDG